MLGIFTSARICRFCNTTRRQKLSLWKGDERKGNKRSSFEGIHLLPAGAMYHNRKIKKERRGADRWRTGKQLHGQPLVKVTTNYERSQGLGGARVTRPTSNTTNLSRFTDKHITPLCLSQADRWHGICIRERPSLVSINLAHSSPWYLRLAEFSSATDEPDYFWLFIRTYVRIYWLIAKFTKFASQSSGKICNVFGSFTVYVYIHVFQISFLCVCQTRGSDLNRQGTIKL